ncbi:MAG TPA: proteasome activator [Acidimicrobiales bacterium]|nr:proteasome activator [Acidimicrobiales bacterium]
MPTTDAESVDRSREATPRPGDLVSSLKAVRLLGALRAGLDEMNRVDIDRSARRRLIATHRAALIEVASTVSDALIEELVTLGVAPLGQDASLDEIKVAQAQLLGWLNGVILAKAALGALARGDVDHDGGGAGDTTDLALVYRPAGA